jgi:hypothetical protein
MMREVSIHAAAVKPRSGVGVACGVWLPWPRRGDLAHRFAVAAGRPEAPERVSWKLVKKRSLPWFQGLLDDLWATRWLSFRAVVDLGEQAADVRAPEELTRLVSQVSAIVDPADVDRRIRVLGDSEEPTPTQRVAKLLAALVQAAFGGRPQNEAQELLLAHLCQLAGCSDLTVLAGSPTARLAVWRPEELRRVQRRSSAPSTSVTASGT